MEGAPENWKDVDLDVIKAIFEQGEKHLESQLQTGMAADQRATTVATIFIGVTTAVVGATITYWSTAHNFPILLAGLSTAIVMLVGTLFILWSSRPIDFYFPGNQPVEWWPAVRSDIKVLIGGETENYQEKINDNALVLERNAKWMGRGLTLSILSPVIGLVIWLFTGPFSLADLCQVFYQPPA